MERPTVARTVAVTAVFLAVLFTNWTTDGGFALASLPFAALGALAGVALVASGPIIDPDLVQADVRIVRYVPAVLLGAALFVALHGLVARIAVTNSDVITGGVGFVVGLGVGTLVRGAHERYGSPAE